MEIDAAGHQLAELSRMLSIGELPIVPDTHEHLEWIAEHSFSIIGDVGLPGRFCTVQTEDDCHAVGCVMCQSQFIRASNHIIYFWLQGRHDHVLIAGTAGYQQIIIIGTNIGILIEFGLEIIYVDCEKEGGKDGALGQTFLRCSRGDCRTVHSHSGCTVYEPRG